MTAVMNGYLDRVPRFKHLRISISDKRTRECYSSIHDAISNLGRAVQLGQHRRLIDALDETFSAETLEAIAVESSTNKELCAALSVYLTTLEQTYAWPRRGTVATPRALCDHKLIVQVLYHEDLAAVLSQRRGLATETRGNPVPLSGLALAMANELLQHAEEARTKSIPLPQAVQDQVNMLFRNCSQDWYSQGDYRHAGSHEQFGRLHEVIRTNGTQRSVQEIFQDNGGIGYLHTIHALLHDMPGATGGVVRALQQLQTSVSLAGEELFGMMIDEVIWGQTFAKFSKPVGYASLGAGGADCPMFRMLDALCGRHDPTAADALLEELTMRSRNFPPNIRSLIHDVASAPSLRALASSSSASPELRHSFAVFQQLMYSLYEMHRKKALRIVLALRAGQLYTSSGTEKAASPERQLAATLQSAMDVRFGTDALSRTIPAYGRVVSRILSSTGHVESARIRFRFDTPIVVGAGDAVIITPVVGGIRESRTYSVTRFSPSTDNGCNEHVVLSPTTSVEICCRNMGAVSSFLCSQHGDCTVRLALQPNPHFRISGNESAKESTLFIAQNGGVGLFCAWLSRQARLVGRYMLLVGVRRLDELLYASDIYDCAEKFGNQLQVIFCLSQPNCGDVQHVKSRGVWPFAGRVVKFLASEPLPPARATYVCGSAEFGIVVAKEIKGARLAKKSILSSRLSPIVTSKMPSLRLHVASSSRAAPKRKTTLRPISRWELARHNAPGDIWISLNGVILDISLLSTFHPGGEKTLMCRAGLEADDMFNSVHAGSFEVKSLLNELQVGYPQDEAPGENGLVYQCLDAIVQIQNDLTNSTRFEERPTGSIHQLPRVPPTEVIQGSWIQFTASWVAMLGKLSLCEEMTQALCGVMDDWFASMAQKQRAVYDSGFYDVKHCAVEIKRLFNAHEEAATAMHGVLDTLKHGLRWVRHDELPKMMAMATQEIIQQTKERTQ
ncbi:cytochrome b5-like Heme/Steroid binding domain-containing protein [Penicillium samsonianum]|uniref:cytochrome b5-like Heme/Steroid binding domain-containing protein n=1 Tax=Penicillium samsonianum TaxID=1882272 RepID=UPI002547547C|nr:cytochrome b5-like Heme/Steroid binding domain-containing protein [Penicillium samsonianum]KAJ6119077.1 cytochrome b5-like Heme/Steroid binding domain-containing protein [Penicillium samsonianum]